MHASILDIQVLLEQTGFKVLELPSSFKIDNWPNWLRIHHKLGEREFQEVATDKAGFNIESPRKKENLHKEQ